MATFEEKYPFEQRKNEATRMRQKFPDRVPVIVDRGNKTNIPDIDKHKYLVPIGLTFSQFIFILRKRIKLSHEQALFVFVKENFIPQMSLTMGELYRMYKGEDNFLCLKYSGETTYG